jgi:basic amino acid/polyamine antiporter, APA family
MTGHSPHLKRQIGLLQLFTLAFGTMIGVGWITVMGAWLAQAGPMGAFIGFAGGGIIVAIIGLCYAELAGMFPVSGGEIAYAYAIYGSQVSFAVSWSLALTYIGLSAFEAISIAWVLGALFDSFGGPVLYSAFGHDVTLHALLAGFAILVLLTLINTHGAKWATRFQDMMTYSLLAISIGFIIAAFYNGNVSNLDPMFVESPIGGGISVGILAIFAVTPFWYAGFDTIPQAMGESTTDGNLKKLPLVIVGAILMALVFYAVVIFATASLMPRAELLALELPMAGVFEAAFGSPILGKAVLVAGLLGLFTTWNAIIFAASRLIFAMGRAHMLPHQLGAVHVKYGSPMNAILFIAAITTILSLLGRNAIIPIVNVGAIALTVVFVAMTFGLLILRKTMPNHERPYVMKGAIILAPLGGIASLIMVYQALIGPYADAGGSWPLEWSLLLLWGALGAVMWIISAPTRRQYSEEERRALILETDE